MSLPYLPQFPCSPDPKMYHLSKRCIISPPPSRSLARSLLSLSLSFSLSRRENGGGRGRLTKRRSSSLALFSSREFGARAESDWKAPQRAAKRERGTGEATHSTAPPKATSNEGKWGYSRNRIQGTTWVSGRGKKFRYGGARR